MYIYVYQVLNRKKLFTPYSKCGLMLHGNLIQLKYINEINKNQCKTKLVCTFDINNK